MQQQHVVETDRAVEASQRGVERVMPGWTSEAVNFIHEFAAAHFSFTTEDIREAAEKRGIELAPVQESVTPAEEKVGSKATAEAKAAAAAKSKTQKPSNGKAARNGNER